MAKYAAPTKVQPGMQLVYVQPNAKRNTPQNLSGQRYARYPKATASNPVTLTLAAGCKWGDNYTPFGKGGPTVADLRHDLLKGFIKLQGTGKPSAPVAAKPAAKPAKGKGKPAKPAAPAPATAQPSAPAAPATAQPSAPAPAK